MPIIIDRSPVGATVGASIGAGNLRQYTDEQDLAYRKRALDQVDARTAEQTRQFNLEYAQRQADRQRQLDEQKATSDFLLKSISQYAPDTLMGAMGSASPRPAGQGIGPPMEAPAAQPDASGASGFQMPAPGGVPIEPHALLAVHALQMQERQRQDAIKKSSDMSTAILNDPDLDPSLKQAWTAALHADPVDGYKEVLPDYLKQKTFIYQEKRDKSIRAATANAFRSAVANYPAEYQAQALAALDAHAAGGPDFRTTMNTLTHLDDLAAGRYKRQGTGKTPEEMQALGANFDRMFAGVDPSKVDQELLPMMRDHYTQTGKIPVGYLDKVVGGDAKASANIRKTQLSLVKSERDQLNSKILEAHMYPGQLDAETLAAWTARKAELDRQAYELASGTPSKVPVKVESLFDKAKRLNESGLSREEAERQLRGYNDGR